MLTGGISGRVQDAEIVIHAPLLTSASLAVVLHAALRTIVDDVGCPCFNVGIYPMPSAAAHATTASQAFATDRVIAR